MAASYDASATPNAAHERKDSGLHENDNTDPGHELRDRWQSRLRVLTLALRGEHHQ